MTKFKGVQDFYKKDKELRKAQERLLLRRLQGPVRPGKGKGLLNFKPKR